LDEWGLGKGKGKPGWERVDWGAFPIGIQGLEGFVKGRFKLLAFLIEMEKQGL
jgi:hypothetical protein